MFYITNTTGFIDDGLQMHGEDASAITDGGEFGVNDLPDVNDAQHAMHQRIIPWTWLASSIS